MSLDEKISDIISSFPQEDIMSGNKIQVEFDYEDLIQLYMGLQSRYHQMDLIIEANEKGN
jgi:hypothetical protein